VIVSEDDLKKISWSEPTFILGEGSNTLFIEDYQGQILNNQMNDFEVKETSDAWVLTCGAGKNWHRLVHDTVVEGMPGLENLALIPGSVGAAPVQNIGAYGVELSHFVSRVRVWDCQNHEFEEFTNEACRFGYRDSLFKQTGNEHLMITSVELVLPKSWKAELSYPDLNTLDESASPQEVMHHVIAVRNAKLPDPAVSPNAGSFFKNPIISNEHFKALRDLFPDIRSFPLSDGRVKLAAAWLIDQAGMKSVSFGGAGVHPKQALVLVNKGQATGADILSLARYIVEQVESKFAVRLEPEVRLIGAEGRLDLG